MSSKERAQNTKILATQNKAPQPFAAHFESTAGLDLLQPTEIAAQLLTPKNVLYLQRAGGNRAVNRLLAQPSRLPHLNARPGVQCQTENQATETPSRFIVEDFELPGPGQINKTQFLASLRQEVLKVVAQTLSQIGQTPTHCPYIPYWFGYYSDKGVEHIDRAIRKYAPGTSGANSWQDYIFLVAERVREGVQTFVSTGSLKDAPVEFQQGSVQQEMQTAEAETLETESEVIQRCGTKNQEGDEEVERDLKIVWEDSGNREIEGYLVKIIPPAGDEPPKVIKQYGTNEVECFDLFSGKRHFPRYYEHDGTYVITSFIGKYPDPAPTLDYTTDDDNLLAQLADICYELSVNGIYHHDLNNNILNHAEELYVIDFGNVKMDQKFNNAMHNNKTLAEQLISSGKTGEFREMLRVKCKNDHSDYNPEKSY